MLDQSVRTWLKLLLLAQLLYLVYAGMFYKAAGRLPPPLFYDSTDTFMDFFNTNYWALNSARFEEWKSIYPIFVFIFSLLFTSQDCRLLGNPLQVRECDAYAIFYLIALYAIACFLCAKKEACSLEEKGSKYSTKWLLFFVYLTAVPALFAMERGNYLLLAFFFLVLSRVSGYSWWSALCLAAAINIKQYLLVLLLVPALFRRWGYLSVVLLGCIAINLFGLLVIQEPKYGLLIENMMGFSQTIGGSYFEKIWNPTSLVAWDKLIEFSPHVQGRLGGEVYMFVSDFSKLGIFSIRVVSLLVFMTMLLRSENLNEQYISLLLLILLMVNTDALGGYSLILLFPYFSAVKDRPLGKLAFLLLIFIFFPAEIPVGPSILDQNMAWLSGRQINQPMSITLGAMARPVLLLFLTGVMLADMLKSNMKMKIVNPRKAENVAA